MAFKRGMLFAAFCFSVTAAHGASTYSFRATASGTLGSTPFTNVVVTFQTNLYSFAGFITEAQFSGPIGSQATPQLTGVHSSGEAWSSVLGRAILAPTVLTASGGALTFAQVGGGSITVTNPAFATLDLNNVPAGTQLVSTTASGPLTFATAGGTLTINSGAVFTFSGTLLSGLTGTTTFTSTTVTAFNVTNISTDVDTFLTRLMAKLNGGSPTYDQTFSVAFSDSTVQSAITAARATVTTAAGSTPVTFTGPTQTSSTRTLQSSTSHTVDGAPVEAVTVTNTNGPAVILIGDGEATPFSIAAGENDIDVTTADLTPRTITTTNTYLNSQTYLLSGSTTPTATPLPPSSILMLAGLSFVGLYAGRRLWQRTAH